MSISSVFIDPDGPLESGSGIVNVEAVSLETRRLLVLSTEYRSRQRMNPPSAPPPASSNSPFVRPLEREGGLVERGSGLDAGVEDVELAVELLASRRRDGVA